MGATVTCTGTGLPAFVAAAGVTGVTLNIGANASITGNALTAGAGTTSQFSNVLVNDSSTINNAGLISNTAGKVRDNVGVNLNGNATTLVNTGTINVTSGAVAATATTTRLYGVISSAVDPASFDDVQVTNRGTISLTQGSAGVARGVYAGENIDTLTINNTGTISVTRTGVGTNTNAVAGVDSDDDTDTLVINNRKAGTITVTGTNTYGVGGRASDIQVNNNGAISALNGAKAAILIYGGSDDGTGTAEIDNKASGTITGNVSITDTSPFGATLPTTTNATRDSTITNEGMITGSFIYGAGNHTLDNTGAISGSITVNQQVGAMGGALTTGIGAASFTLTNEGTLGGNITINDRPDSVNKITLTGTGFNPNGTISTTGNGSNRLNLIGVTNLGSVQNFSVLNLTTSNVAVANGVSLVDGSRLLTTVYGTGGTTANPSTKIGTIAGTLTLAGTTRIVPTFAAIVQNGGVYQVASAVTGGPVKTAAGSALVSTTASTSTGSLLLTTQVRNASAVAGITPAGAATLNGLLAYTGANAQLQKLGVIVQGLGTDAAVAQAGTALSPIVNGADVQIPINATMLFHQQIDARLDNFLYTQIPVSGRSADLGVRPVPVYGALPASGAWIEGIDGGVHQSTQAGVTGYTADLTGVIGGYDRLVLPNVRVGGAFGFLDGSTNYNLNLMGNRDSVQTYQGLVYAAYEGPIAYLRGSVGYGGVNYHDTRNIAFAGFNDVAVSSHSGNILTVRGEAGVPYEYRNSLVVPYAAFTYNHLSQGGYSETSGAGAALSYQGVTNDSERSEVGGKVIVPIGTVPVFTKLLPFGSAIAIEARGAYVHEFGNVAQVVTASFVGSGNVFVASGPTPNRDMVDGGVGIRLANGPAVIDLSYNALARTSYLQQVGLIRAKYLF